jgi:hypothetical protein
MRLRLPVPCAPTAASAGAGSAQQCRKQGGASALPILHRSGYSSIGMTRQSKVANAAELAEQVTPAL